MVRSRLERRSSPHVDKGIADERRLGCGGDQDGERELEPGSRADAEGEKWPGIDGDIPPIGAQVELLAGQVVGRRRPADRGEGIEDGRHPPICPGRRPVGARQVLERKSGPLAVVIEAEDHGQERAPQRSKVAVLGAGPVRGRVRRADLHERRAAAGLQVMVIRHDPTGGGVGRTPVGCRPTKPGGTPSQGALDAVDVGGRRRFGFGHGVHPSSVSGMTARQCGRKQISAVTV